MSRLFAPIVALLLVAGQASVASAATKDAPVLTKTSMPSCVVPAKGTKVAKTAVRVNRCDTDDHRFRFGAVPLVFTGAAIAGIVAIAVSSNNNNDNVPTSP